jgi:hypothetical protein
MYLCFLYISILRAKQISPISENKTMSSMTIPIQHVSSIATPSSLKSSVSVCSDIDAQHLHNNRDTNKKQQLLHAQPQDQQFNAALNSIDDDILQETTIKAESTDKIKITTAAPGLPSPTDSISETSDYQRSIPSPKDELESTIGNYSNRIL